MKALLFTGAITLTIQAGIGEHCPAAYSTCFNQNFIPQDFESYYWRPDFRSGIQDSSSTGVMQPLFKYSLSLLGIAFAKEGFGPLLNVAKPTVDFLESLTGTQDQQLSSTTKKALKDILRVVDRKEYEKEINEFLVEFYIGKLALENFATLNLPLNWGPVTTAVLTIIGKLEATEISPAKFLAWPIFCEQFMPSAIVLGRTSPNVNVSRSVDNLKANFTDKLCSKTVIEKADEYLEDLTARVKVELGSWWRTKCVSNSNTLQPSFLSSNGPKRMHTPTQQITFAPKALSKSNISANGPRSMRQAEVGHWKVTDTIDLDQLSIEGYNGKDITHMEIYKVSQEVQVPGNCDPEPSQSQRNTMTVKTEACECRYHERIRFPAYQLLQKNIYAMAHRFEAILDRSLAKWKISVDCSAPQRIKEIEIFGVDGSKIPMLYVRRPYSSDLIEKYYTIIDGDVSTFANVDILAPENGLYGVVFEFQSDIHVAEIRLRLQDPLVNGNSITVNMHQGNGYVTVASYSGTATDFVLRQSYSIISRGPTNSGQYLHMTTRPTNNDQINTRNLQLGTNTAAVAERFQFQLNEPNSNLVDIMSMVGTPGCYFNFRPNKWWNFHGNCGESNHEDRNFLVMRGGPEDSTYRIRSQHVNEFLKPGNSNYSPSVIAQPVTLYVDNAARLELIPRYCPSSNLCVKEISTSSSTNSVFTIPAVGVGIFFMGAMAVATTKLHNRRRRSRSEAERIKKDLSTDVENDIDPSTDF